MTAKDFAKVDCQICGAKAHFLELHLKEAHEMTVAEYTEKFPGAPVLSRAAEAKLAQLERVAAGDQIDGDIKKLFGVTINDHIKTVPMFEAPQETTPKSDPDYIFRKGTLSVFLFAMMNPDQMALYTGPTGSGKSSIIEQGAARLNWGFYRLNGDADITRADFVGQWVLKGKDMAFQYGILPKAMREGAIIVIDEWDTLSPAVGMVLQPVLEGKPLTITETGEVIQPHKNFRIFATSNTIGQGDTTGLYNGTQPQNFATLDRFDIVEIVDYPAKEDEAKILTKKTGITDKGIINKIIETATLFRDAFKKGETVCTMSTRTIINIGQKLIAFGNVKRAYELAFLNKLNADDKQFGYEIIQRVWGTV